MQAEPLSSTRHLGANRKSSPVLGPSQGVWTWVQAGSHTFAHVHICAYAQTHTQVPSCAHMACIQAANPDACGARQACTCPGEKRLGVRPAEECGLPRRKSQCRSHRDAVASSGQCCQVQAPESQAFNLSREGMNLDISVKSLVHHSHCAGQKNTSGVCGLQSARVLCKAPSEPVPEPPGWGHASPAVHHFSRGLLLVKAPHLAPGLLPAVVFLCAGSCSGKTLPKAAEPLCQDRAGHTTWLAHLSDQCWQPLPWGCL